MNRPLPIHPAGGLGRSPGPRARDASPARRMPPFALPGEHFAAALGWFVLGAVGLVAVAPELARSAWLSPRVIGVTHLFTLGWITTSIFGVLYQIYPVALGVGARSVPVGHATFWTLQGGVILLVAGAWWWRPAVLAAGWVTLFFAVGGMAWNLLPARRTAHRGRRIGAYVSAGHMGLGLAMFVIAASVGAFQGWWVVDRLGVLSAHVHLAVVGFATLTAVGVGSQLLPNFLHARGHPEWPLRWIGPLVFGGLVVFAAGEIWTLRWATLSGGAVTAAGIGLYLWLAAGYFLRRSRRRLERPLKQIAAAHLFLAAALGVGLGLLVRGGAGGRLPVVYGILGILGWLALLVAGVYGKIVPFLSWLARYGGRRSRPGVPSPTELTSAVSERARLGLFLAGVALLAHGAGAGSPGAALIGASLFAAGGLLLAVDGLGLILPALWSERSAARARERESGSDATKGKRTRRDQRSRAMRRTRETRARLDVRPILVAGEEPLAEILQAASAVPEEGELEIIAPFEPVPLYRELARRGFGHRTESRGTGEWAVRFIRTAVTPAATVASVHERHPETAEVLAAHGVDLCCGGGKTLQFVAAAHRIELHRLLAELQEAVVAGRAPTAIREGDCGCGGCACDGG